MQRITSQIDSRRLESTTRWSGELVRQRLVEAFAIERRMPPDRFATMAASWPATPLHTFVEMLHWDDARQRVWDDWTKAKGVYSFEVSRMDEAINWLGWCDVGERRCLAAWAASKARNLPIRKVLKHHGWSPTTFYRAIEKAADRIAIKLNQQGVQVR